MLDMTLSVAGLYDYDNRLFDQLALPEGYDHDDVVSNILMECAELEVVYPSWDAMRAAIGMWSRSMLWTWKKRYEVSQVEYAPLENLKRETTQTEDTPAPGTAPTQTGGTALTMGRPILMARTARPPPVATPPAARTPPRTRLSPGTAPPVRPERTRPPERPRVPATSPRPPMGPSVLSPVRTCSSRSGKSQSITWCGMWCVTSSAGFVSLSIDRVRRY